MVTVQSLPPGVNFTTLETAFAVLPEGWLAYPDPANPVGGYVAPNSLYPELTSLLEQLNSTNTTANRTLCGHSSATPANLSDWAYHSGNPLPQCEGAIYALVLALLLEATTAQNSGLTQPMLGYNELSQLVGKLGLFVWYGQANAVPEVAPWVNLPSLNLNPALRGSNDQPWFHVQFKGTNSVTFKELKLPAGAHWGVNSTYGFPNDTTVAAGKGTAGSVTISSVPNGPFSFQIVPPTGYGVAKIMGPGSPNQTSANIAASTTFKVLFGQLQSYQFAQSLTVGKGKLHMYTGAPWLVYINTSLPHGGDPNHYVVNGAGTYTPAPLFLPKGGHYKFTVVGFPSIYKALPSHGGFGVPAKAMQKLIKFKLLTEVVKFKESGLTKGATWTVTLTGAAGASAAWFAADCGGLGCSQTTDKAVHVFRLPTGNYTYSATGSTTVTGYVNVTAPSAAQVITVTF